MDVDDAPFDFGSMREDMLRQDIIPAVLQQKMCLKLSVVCHVNFLSNL